MNDFENLVLLIGTNPLPNYIVAKYFSDKNSNLKNIFLIYSSGNKFQSSTKEFVENIKSVLECNGLRSDIKIHFIPIDDIEKKQNIYNCINNYLNTNPVSGKVHLNYTGGTKVMGIHSYEFFKEKFNERVEYSYLSPKIFKIINDDGNNESEDLRKEVKSELKNILELHGFKRINDENKIIFRDALNKFEKLIDKDILINYFKSYERKNFINDKNKLISTGITLTKKFKHKKIVDELLIINNLLPDDFKIFDKEGSLIEKLPLDINIKKTVEFFDGFWLEDYVETVLSDLNSNKNFKIYKNWEIKKPDWKNDSKFELDLLIMNGYQLFGISCTTNSKRAECKRKGFEIFMRTRQIGGDESKSILITRLTKDVAIDLQNELEIDTGGSKNILVLGEQDLKKNNLINKINDFLE